MRSTPLRRAAHAAAMAGAVLAAALTTGAGATEPEAKPASAPAAAAPAPDASAPAPSPATPAPEAAAPPPKPRPLPPSLVARINLTLQTMTVQVGGKTVHSWRVSTGRAGFATPPGTFRPSWMAKMWYSKQYDDAPMPHSVFFNGGIATHGTTATGLLGRPASHGCVRLAPGNAAAFYKLVSKHGMAQTRIVVHGKQPFAAEPRVAKRNTGRGNGRTAARTRRAEAPTPPVRISGRWPGDSYGYTPTRAPGRAPYWVSSYR